MTHAPGPAGPSSSRGPHPRPAVAPDDLRAARYGETASPRQRRLRTRLVVVVAAVLGAAVVVWLAIGVLQPDVTSQDVGFTVRDETSVEVVFDVHLPPGARATCTVEALSSGFGQVGLVDVEVGPTDRSPVRVRVDVATSELAATGIVRDCALQD